MFVCMAGLAPKAGFQSPTSKHAEARRWMTRPSRRGRHQREGTEWGWSGARGHSPPWGPPRPTTIPCQLCVTTPGLPCSSSLDISSVPGLVFPLPPGFALRAAVAPFTVLHALRRFPWLRSAASHPSTLPLAFVRLDSLSSQSPSPSRCLAPVWEHPVPSCEKDGCSSPTLCHPRPSPSHACELHVESPGASQQTAVAVAVCRRSLPLPLSRPP